MTISQSTLRQGSRPLSAAPVRRIVRAIVRWQERRRAHAELARLAQVGDYLLRDVGLDPGQVRVNPTAILEKMMRQP